MRAHAARTRDDNYDDYDDDCDYDDHRVATVTVKTMYY